MEQNSDKEANRLYALYCKNTSVYHDIVIQLVGKDAFSRDPYDISCTPIRPFAKAARIGSLTALKFMVAVCDDSKSRNDVIYKHLGVAFEWAAGNNHCHVLKYLLSLTIDSQMRDNMVYEGLAFRKASTRGNIDVLMYLISILSTSSKIDSIEICSSYFCDAIVYGHTDIVDCLLSVLPNSEKRNEVIFSGSNLAFPKLSDVGNLDMMKYLVTQNKDTLKCMIESNKHGAFRYAAEKGYLHILEYIVSLYSDTSVSSRVMIYQMIHADEYYAFRYAITNEHLSVVKFIVNLVQDKITRKKMITCDYYRIFSIILRKNNKELLDYMLTFIDDSTDINAILRTVKNIRTVSSECLSSLYSKRHQLKSN